MATQYNVFGPGPTGRYIATTTDPLTVAFYAGIGYRTAVDA